MRRVLFVPLLFACGTPAYLPDGGRPRQVCESTLTVIPVHAVDAMGAPLGNATITATNQSTGAVQTGTTNGNGDTAAITDELGRGQIEITAEAGALKTKQGFLVEIACDSCDCTAMPGFATVTLYAPPP
jgi:hypothetical protein